MILLKIHKNLKIYPLLKLRYDPDLKIKIYKFKYDI